MAHTPWVQPEPPTVGFTPQERPDGTWSTVLAFTPAGRVPAEAVSPGAGVHEVAQGSAVHHYYLPPAVAELIRQGEAEHVADFSYAQLLVSQTISQVLYRLAAQRPPTAPTREQALACAWAWLWGALPPQLRWHRPQGTPDVRFMWLQRQNTLAGPTFRVRDHGGEHWHQVGRRLLTRAEKRRVGIPERASVAYEVTVGNSQIGVHPPQEIIDPVWTGGLPRFE